MPIVHSENPVSRLALVWAKIHTPLEGLFIAGGAASMTLLTMPALRANSSSVLTTILWFCFGFFVLDVLIKSWIQSVEKRWWRYLISAEGLIDVLAVVPVPIAFLNGIPPHLAWLFASLWLLKFAVRAHGLRILGRVIVLEADALGGVFLIFVTVTVVASVIIFLLESSGQPEHFGDLPSSLWWAVTTVTTTGYGDSIPRTFLGRLTAAIVMVCGLGVFGLLTGILITGFTAERRRRDVIRNWDLVRRVPFLRDLDAPALIELTRVLRPLDLTERTVVVREGQRADCMYFIALGEVDVRVAPKSIRLGPGSFFGEIALLEGGTRNATVITRAPSTLLVLDASDFRAFMAHHPELAKTIETEARRRVENLQQIS